jgi:outer membrane protein
MHHLFRRAIKTSLASLALGAALPACADEAPLAHWQVKLLATAVLPDGKISSVEAIAPALAANAAFAAPQTVASDNAFTPTLAIEYFLNRDLSLETIAGITAHHLNGSGSLAGTNVVNHILIVPATLTLKYHLPLGAIRPYLGVGPSLFIVRGERPGGTATALGVTDVKLSSNLGLAAQAGVDIPIGKTGYGLSLDAKKYWVGTTANFHAGSTDVLTTRHTLNPWVLSAGVSYRF